MRDLRLMIGAGQVEEIAAVGAYLRIKSASVPLLIEIEGGKSRFEIAKGGSANLLPFTRFSVSHSSPTDQAVVIAVGQDGEEQTEGVMTGEVSVSNLRSISQATGSFNVQRTVTGGGASVIASGNPNRAFLIVQNGSETGSIWLCLNNSATKANGFRLGPGESLQFAGGICPTGSMTAIGDALSNPDVVVMEGTF